MNMQKLFGSLNWRKLTRCFEGETIVFFPILLQFRVIKIADDAKN